MARTYAKVRIDIWADDDFRQLTDPAQALYFRLMTSPTLSLAGVADWRPVRLAHLTRGMTAQQLSNAASELAEALYVVVDENTEEILLRSFIRHDGIMKYPNIATSMLKDYAAIFSSTLKGVVVHELRRLHDEEPDMAGWKVIGGRLDDRAIDPAELTPFNGSNLVPEQFDSGSNLVPEQFDSGSNLVPEQFDSGSANGYPNGSYIPQPSTLNLQPSSLIPSESPDDDPTPVHNKANDEKFQEFWDAYPKQAGRPKALTEWHRAVTQGVAPDVLTAKARNYAEQVSHEQREDRFVKAPSNWLREGDYHNTWKPSQPPMTAEQRRMANLPRVVPGEFY